jgi:NAD(P)H-dependent FMN reductase
LQQGESSISGKIDVSAKMERPLFIPIILGTARQGRQSENVARFVFEQTKKRVDVETELIDVRELPMKLDDAGEQMKDPKFSAAIDRCDGLIIVTPEYNHGYPGLLKHALDMNLKEYIHKAVGICGVSAGPFGGARVIEGLLPVMRELGLVTIFEDVNFGKVQEIFDEEGRLLDQRYVPRVDKFLNELIWMARVLRHGRENTSE